MSTESIHLAGGPFLPRLEMRDGKKRCRGSQLELCTGKLSVEMHSSGVHGASPSRSHSQRPWQPRLPGPTGFLSLEEHRLWSQGLSPGSITY